MFFNLDNNRLIKNNNKENLKFFLSEFRTQNYKNKK